MLYRCKVLFLSCCGASYGFILSLPFCKLLFTIVFPIIFFIILLSCRKFRFSKCDFLFWHKKTGWKVYPPCNYVFLSFHFTLFCIGFILAKFVRFCFCIKESNPHRTHIERCFDKFLFYIKFSHGLILYTHLFIII